MAAFFAVVAMVAAWPTHRFGARAIPGPPLGPQYGDAVVFLWNFYRVDRWLHEGEPLLAPTDGNRPWGYLFLCHTHSLAYALLGLALEPWLPGGEAAAADPTLDARMARLARAYNAAVLCVYALGGLAMWWLARTLGLGRVAAAMAGALFVAGGHRSGHLWGHLNLICVEAMPLLALGVWWMGRGARRDGRAARLAAGSALVAVATIHTLYSDYYVTFYLALLAAGAGAGYAAAAPRGWGGALARPRLYGAAAATLAVILVAGAPVWWSWREAFTRWEAPFFPGFWKGGDVRTVLSPLGETPLRALVDALAGAREARGLEPRSMDLEAEMYVGWAALLLVATALLLGPERRWLRRLRWALLAGAVAFFALALGHPIRWGGVETSLPGPYWLIARSESLRQFRVPGRFMLPFALPWALLAGIGAQALVDRARRGGWRRATALGAALTLVATLALLEGWRGYQPSPLARDRAAIPYGLLERVRDAARGDDADDGSVALLPLLHFRAERDLFQVLHGRPLYDTYLGRFDQQATRLLLHRTTGLWRTLWNVEVPGTTRHLAEVEEVAPADRLRAHVAAFDVRWLLVGPMPNLEDVVGYYEGRLSTGGAWRETDAAGQRWALVEVAREADPRQIVVADAAWGLVPADANEALAPPPAATPPGVVPRAAGTLVRPEARLFLRVPAAWGRARAPFLLRAEVEVEAGVGEAAAATRLLDPRLEVRWDGEVVADAPLAGEGGGEGGTREVLVALAPQRVEPGWRWITLRPHAARGELPPEAVRLRRLVVARGDEPPAAAAAGAVGDAIGDVPFGVRHAALLDELPREERAAAGALPPAPERDAPPEAPLGCWPAEPHPVHGEFRWATTRALLPVRAGTTTWLLLAAPHSDAAARPVVVTLAGPGVAPRRLTLAEPWRERWVEVVVAPAGLDEAADPSGVAAPARLVPLELRVDRAFVPARATPENPDPRHLGVALFGAWPPPASFRPAGEP